MFLKKSYDKGKVFATALLVGGAILLVKLNQDARYMAKDVKTLSKKDLNERDLEQMQHKFKLSSAEIKALKAQKDKKSQVVENKIHSDPSFEHKRAKGMD